MEDDEADEAVVLSAPWNKELARPAVDVSVTERSSMARAGACSCCLSGAGGGERARRRVTVPIIPMSYASRRYGLRCSGNGRGWYGAGLAPSSCTAAAGFLAG